MRVSDEDLRALYESVAERVAELIKIVDRQVGDDDDRKIQLSRIAFEHVEGTANEREKTPDDPAAQRRQAVALTTYTLLNLPRGELVDGTSPTNAQAT